MSQIDKLLESLAIAPAMRVMHFAKEPTLCDNISNFCKKSEDSEYLIYTFYEEALEALKAYENSYTQVKLTNPKRPKYNIQGRLYDYLFLTTLPVDRDSFFKRVYSALKNAGLVFIFLKKEQRELSYKIESELIESNYVAVNRMILDNFLIISTKKMHGWSGA